MYHIKTKTIQGGRGNEKRLRITQQKIRKENGKAIAFKTSGKKSSKDPSSGTETRKRKRQYKTKGGDTRTNRPKQYPLNRHTEFLGYVLEEN